MNVAIGSKFRALTIVTAFIVLTDALFIYINYRSSWNTLQRDLVARTVHLRSGFEISLRTTASNMQQIATYIANEKVVQDMFLAGKKAVEKEGGGPGGVEADRIRKRLYMHVKDGWEEMTANYDVRQLHFHLGPGSLSFLRVHRPEKFGDRMDDVRFTIVDVNHDLKPVKGFETGRVYSGIRGVVPVFAYDPDTGVRQHVGALEAGTSLALLLNHLRAATGYQLTALLTRDHLERNVWPEFSGHRLTTDAIGDDYVIEETTTDSHALLQRPDVLSAISSGVPVVLKDKTDPLAVMAFPFLDYRQSKRENGRPVGYIVAWQSVASELAAIKKDLLTNIEYGLIVFCLVELILLLSWHFGTKGLQSIIRRRTQEIESANLKLNNEIAEKRLAEARLRSSERRYRSMFMDNKAVMLLVDPQSGRIVDCNHTACAYYGYDRKTVLALYLRDIQDGPQQQEGADLASWQDASINVDDSVRHLLATGEYRDVSVYSGPIEQNGVTLNFLIIVFQFSFFLAQFVL